MEILTQLNEPELTSLTKKEEKDFKVKKKAIALRILKSRAVSSVGRAPDF